MCSPRWSVSPVESLWVFFSSLRFECSIGVSSLPTQYFTAWLWFSALLWLPLLLCLARKQTLPSSSRPPLLTSTLVSFLLYHKVSTYTISASLLLFYGVGPVFKNVKSCEFVFLYVVWCVYLCLYSIKQYKLFLFIPVCLNSCYNNSMQPILITQVLFLIICFMIFQLDSSAF